MEKQGKPYEKRVYIITEDKQKTPSFSRGTVIKIICERKSFLEIRFFLEFLGIEFSQFCSDVVRELFDQPG